MTKTSTKTTPRTKSDYTTKLKKLEEEKLQLVQQRKDEIFAIIDKAECLGIDNELLAGAFAILKEISQTTQNLPDNLKAFELLIREKAPKFFRRKPRSTKKLETTQSLRK